MRFPNHIREHRKARGLSHELSEKTKESEPTPAQRWPVDVELKP